MADIGLKKIAYATTIAIVLGCSYPAYSKSVTMNDITIDLPSDFKASDSDKGMKTQTADGAVDVWFERYPADGVDRFVADNKQYWKKHQVELPNAPTKTEGKIGDGLDYFQLDFGGATWKGDPTVVRYVFFSPSSDPKADMIVITIWGTPEGDDAHGAEIVKMVGTAKAK